VKAAWGRIRERYAEKLSEIEEKNLNWADSPSIFHQIQIEYREGRITEPERDAMREYVRAWLGDPATADRFNPMHNYASYACGLWAATAGPMGEDEHAIILATVQILELEAA
jgi:hypothetical protein